MPMGFMLEKILFLDNIALYGKIGYEVCRVGLILAPDILTKDISAKIFHQEDFLARGHFGMGIHILPPWMFQQRNVRALGHFGIRIFWHVDISALYKAMAFHHRHFSTGTSLC